jgi:hypothetical protein
MSANEVRSWRAVIDTARSAVPQGAHASGDGVAHAASDDGAPAGDDGVRARGDEGARVAPDGGVRAAGEGGRPRADRVGADVVNICPLCGERLDGHPARCFRCEGDLEEWWRIDALITGLGREEEGTRVAGEFGDAVPSVEVPGGRATGDGMAGGVLRDAGASAMPVGAAGCGLPARRAPRVRTSVLATTVALLALMWGGVGFVTGWVLGVEMPAADVASDQPMDEGGAPQEDEPEARSTEDDRELWLALTYTVQRGDSPWRIAAALTGSGRNWVWIWAFNGLSDNLRPGDQLEIRLQELPVSESGGRVKLSVGTVPAHRIVIGRPLSLSTVITRAQALCCVVSGAQRSLLHGPPGSAPARRPGGSAAARRAMVNGASPGSRGWHQ